MIGIKSQGSRRQKSDAKKAAQQQAEAEQLAEAEGEGKKPNKFLVRQAGAVIRDSAINAVELTAEEQEGVEEQYLSWRSCRGCCRLSMIHCKRRLRQCRHAVAQHLKSEFESTGALKTPTWKRISRFGKLSGGQARTEIREWLAKKKIEIFGEPKEEKIRKGKITSHRVIAKPDVGVGFSLASFVIHNEAHIVDYFELDEHDKEGKQEIGVGGCAHVLKCAERMTHVMRAVKRINKRDVGDEQFLKNEVNVMKGLDHANIPKLFEIFEDDKHVFLVMELCEGGDLLDHLLEASHMNEPQVGIIMKTVLMTLNYLHSNQVVHRDVKPENVIFRERRPDIVMSNIRLADYGFARFLPEDKNEFMYTKVGSPYYIAPEILNGEGYTKTCDIWSAGVMCYMLLCGYPPFAANTDAETLALVKKGKYIFPKEHWKIISRPCKHIIAHMMMIEPHKRISLRKALEHVWIRSKGLAKLERMREETVDRLITFHKHHNLRRAAMLAISYQMDAQDLTQIRDLYQSLDANGDGLLQRTEFMKGVQSCGVDEQFVQEMIRSVDADGSGLVDYTEFIAATIEKDAYIKNHAVCLRAFRSFDQDDSGQLSMKEVAEILDMSSTEHEQEVEYFFNEVDANKDGLMDYREFHDMLEVEIEAFKPKMDIEKAEGGEDSDDEFLHEDEFDTHVAAHEKAIDDEPGVQGGVRKSRKKTRDSEGEDPRKSRKSKGPAPETLGIENDLVEAEIAANKEAEREEEEEARKKAEEEEMAAKSSRKSKGTAEPAATDS